jgi:type II secretory pathway pseudopilin PulG
MKPFSKHETFVVSGILIFVVLITFYNLSISIRRARDAQRKADLGAISDALHKYFEDFGFFPPSENGKILACKSDEFDRKFEEIKKEEIFDRSKFFAILAPCQWGKDSLRDVSDNTYDPYLTSLPQDPKTGKGITYLYLSNTKRFQVYTHLEGGKSEDGYDEGIVKRNLACGPGFICSFGKSSGVTPLDKSIEEYENELIQKGLTTGLN